MPSLSFQLTRTFQHNGWSIRYSKLEQPDTQTQNPANTIIFVHGTPWSSSVFQPLAQALHATGRYSIILYDLPGYGQSQQWTRPEGHTAEPDTSVRAQGLALVALLKHLHLTDNGPGPQVIAHDIAGVISLRAHLLHGCHYQSLCLLDTNCVLPWGDKLYNLVRSSPKVFEEMPASVFRGALKAIIRSARSRAGTGLGVDWEDILARPWLDDGESEADGADPALRPQASFVRQIKQADDTHTAELEDQRLYGKVRCPVKILWGEQDQWIPGEKMDKLAGMLGDNLKAYVHVPDAGHLIMLDQPERVAIEISTWLEFGR